jgi:AraC-like DNA-binding protein
MPSSVSNWSTAGIDPYRALSYWVETVCDRFLELEIEAPLRSGFHASLDQAAFGPATINLISADAQRVRRTVAKIARARAPSFLLMQLREGRVRVRQRNRAIELYPGECVLIAGGEPYEVECPQPTRSLVLQIPDDWLRRHLEHPEAGTPIPLTAGGDCAALCSAVDALDLDAEDAPALPPDEVLEQIGALLSFAVRSSTTIPGGRPLIERLLRSIRGRLSEPDLTPRSIAAEHRVSVRSLHYAFAPLGTTFAEALMRARLEQARALLLDRRMRELPIADVAARCGFLDPSHFARRFRRAYGVAPLALRAMASH